MQVMRYTAGQINYGGRVTDDWDRRTIGHLLSQHYHPDVVRAEHQFDAAGVFKQVCSRNIVFACQRCQNFSPLEN